PLPDSGSFSIGRGATTDTRLTDVRVSRNHCEIQVIGDQLVINDLQSAVGTFVNEQRINEGHPLHDSDVIRIGDTQLRVEEENIALQATVAGILPHDLQSMAQKALAVPFLGGVGTGIETTGGLPGLVGSSLGDYDLISIVAAGLNSVIFRGK